MCVCYCIRIRIYWLIFLKDLLLFFLYPVFIVLSLLSSQTHTHTHTVWKLYIWLLNQGISTCSFYWFIFCFYFPGFNNVRNFMTMFGIWQTSKSINFIFKRNLNSNSLCIGIHVISNSMARLIDVYSRNVAFKYVSQFKLEYQNLCSCCSPLIFCKRSNAVWFVFEALTILWLSLNCSKRSHIKVKITFLNRIINFKQHNSRCFCFYFWQQKVVIFFLFQNECEIKWLLSNNSKSKMSGEKNNSYNQQIFSLHLFWIAIGNEILSCCQGLFIKKNNCSQCCRLV